MRLGRFTILFFLNGDFKPNLGDKKMMFLIFKINLSLLKQRSDYKWDFTFLSKCFKLAINVDAEYSEYVR